MEVETQARPSSHHPGDAGVDPEALLHIRRKAIDINCEQEVLGLGLHVCVAYLGKLNVRKSSPEVKGKKKEIVALIRDNLPLEVLASHEYVAGHKDLYERVGAEAEGLVPSYQTCKRRSKSVPPGGRTESVPL